MDLEVVTEPTQTGVDIVSVAEMKQHMRITHSMLDDQIEAAIEEVAASLHGRRGILNRTVFPTRYVRYFSSWDSCRRTIKLPYPPLIEVVAITVDDGGSPLTEVDASDYIVRAQGIVGEIQFLSGVTLPTPVVSPRAIGIVYDAGYQEYPHNLRRLIKIMAAHNIENTEATINEPRQMQINRMVELGYGWLLNQLRVPYWED